MMNTDRVRTFRPLSALVPDPWRSETLQTVDGATLHYIRTGNTTKPTILLLHGLQVDGASWLRVAQALEPRYDVVMPDMRGHGRSSRAEANFSSALLVNEVNAIIDGLHLKTPIVVGHSMGAEIAGRFAAAHPDRLCAVVLVDPALRVVPLLSSDSDQMPGWMQHLLQSLQALKSMTFQERMMAGLNMLPPTGQMLQEADYVPFIEGMALFDLAVYRYPEALRALFTEPEVIKQITVPALLMTARPMMPGMDISEGVNAYQANWPHGQHVHFPNAGHAIHFDELDKFVEVLGTFVASL
jgi:pimeloyl-ACP methyl ester carboxylesterase